MYFNHHVVCKRKCIPLGTQNWVVLRWIYFIYSDQNFLEEKLENKYTSSESMYSLFQKKRTFNSEFLCGPSDVNASSIHAQFFSLENSQPFWRYFKKAWKHVSKQKLQFSEISIRINANDVTFIQSILKHIDKRCVLLLFSWNWTNIVLDIILVSWHDPGSGSET